MHDLKSTYDKLYPIVKISMENYTNNSGNIKKSGSEPTFSEVSVITLSLTAECLSIDSLSAKALAQAGENFLFKKLNSGYKDAFPGLIERSRYNRRRRKLSEYIDLVRRYLVDRLIPYEDLYILDSMPLEVCKLTRAKRSTIRSENYSTAPNYGYCASHNTYYYGYKLHGMCSLSGVVTSVDISILIVLYLVIKDRVHTMTSDNRKEFAKHESITHHLGTDFYFAHPYASHERGLNKNTNGLIRQYFPKNRNFRTITIEEIKKAK